MATTATRCTQCGRRLRLEPDDDVDLAQLLHELNECTVRRAAPGPPRPRRLRPAVGTAEALGVDWVEGSVDRRG